MDTDGDRDGDLYGDRRRLIRIPTEADLKEDFIRTEADLEEDSIRTEAELGICQISNCDRHGIVFHRVSEMCSV
jgi:hypothetical protein